MVFETRLPVVSHSPVQGYQLKAFPVWGIGNRTEMLDIARYAAPDTASRTILEPHSCKRNDPVVCSQGIVQHDGCACSGSA